MHPVIDVHGHWGPWFFAMDIGSVDENIRVMDEWGISLQVVSASEAVVYDAPGGNAHLAAVLADTPRLRGYVVANPNNLAATRADLDRYLGTDAFVGVKIHTGYPLREISSPQMRDLFALLDEYAAVVLIHTWGRDVLDLLPLLSANPRVRAIAGHMAATRWDLAAEAASACDRLYLEPSCSITDAGQVAYVAEHAPAGQLLFGTDATLIDPAVSVGLVTDADLPPELAERLYWRNAAELFGLTVPADAVLGPRL
ncbi:MAG TPA: amidohydrolase family protein [Actinocatenispora sp.]